MKVLRALAGNRLDLQMTEAPIGQAGVDAAGVPLPSIDVGGYMPGDHACTASFVQAEMALLSADKCPGGLEGQWSHGDLNPKFNHAMVA